MSNLKTALGRIGKYLELANNSSTETIAFSARDIALPEDLKGERALRKFHSDMAKKHKEAAIEMEKLSRTCPETEKARLVEFYTHHLNEFRHHKGQIRAIIKVDKTNIGRGKVLQSPTEITGKVKPEELPEWVPCSHRTRATEEAPAFHPYVIQSNPNRYKWMPFRPGLADGSAGWQLIKKSKLTK